MALGHQGSRHSFRNSFHTSAPGREAGAHSHAGCQRKRVVVAALWELAGKGEAPEERLQQQDLASGLETVRAMAPVWRYLPLVSLRVLVGAAECLRLLWRKTAEPPGLTKKPT